MQQKALRKKAASDSNRLEDVVNKPRGIRVLYISPLKALGVDVDRNLRAPKAGLQRYAERNSVDHQVPTVAIRSGDSSPKERALILKHPPDILITTPESLYLMLTSRADAVLASVETIIIDEIHSLAGTKRGSHLSSTLQRLERLRKTAGLKQHSDINMCQPLQRIGLSATQRPLEEIARLLGGGHASPDPNVPVKPRPVQIIDASEKKRFAVTTETPAENVEPPELVAHDPDRSKSTGDTSSAPAIPSVWPSIHPRLVELIRQNRSTMIFVNSRRLAERLAAAINELAEEEIALTHHGSIAKEIRAEIEDRLKPGDHPAMVATLSMELGIDMGLLIWSSRSKRLHQSPRQRNALGGADIRLERSPRELSFQNIGAIWSPAPLRPAQCWMAGSKQHIIREIRWMFWASKSSPLRRGNRFMSTNSMPLFAVRQFFLNCHIHHSSAYWTCYPVGIRLTNFLN